MPIFLRSRSRCQNFTFIYFPYIEKKTDFLIVEDQKLKKKVFHIFLQKTSNSDNRIRIWIIFFYRNALCPHSYKKKPFLDSIVLKLQASTFQTIKISEAVPGREVETRDSWEEEWPQRRLFSSLILAGIGTLPRTSL
jgi:hypothetical protein